MKRIHLKREPNLTAKFDAFPYQKEAFDAVKDLEYAAVFHEQGLGKTKIAIDLLLYWLGQTSIDTVLIVTKKQLVPNWLREFKMHTSIKPAILDTNKQDHDFVFTGPARVVVTHFEVLVAEKARFELYLTTRNVAIIVDESTKLKNPNTALTRTFFELAPLFHRRVIMTGTPVANRPYDIWAQIFFLDQGKSLGTDFKAFQRETNLSNKLSASAGLQSDFEDAVSGIHARIKDFSVRETKNCKIIALPDKVYLRESAEFTPEQRELYERIREQLKIEVLKDGQRVEDDSSAIVKRLLRLVQVTSNPRLVDESFSGASAKEAVLDGVLRRILDGGEKCIVWSCFIENVNFFCKKYAGFGSVKVHGGMTMADRNRAVERFYTDQARILFATPASAKEGLTLTTANHVVFYDRGFSLDDYLQAQDRIHRISQTKTCYIHNIIMNNSIDQWVDLLLNSKQNAAFLAQGDLSLEDYQEVADYSFGDLINAILFPEQEEFDDE